MEYARKIRESLRPEEKNAGADWAVSLFGEVGREIAKQIAGKEVVILFIHMCL